MYLNPVINLICSLFVLVFDCNKPKQTNSRRSFTTGNAEKWNETRWIDCPGKIFLFLMSFELTTKVIHSFKI